MIINPVSWIRNLNKTKVLFAPIVHPRLKDLNIMNYYPKENFYDSNNRPINNYYCKKNHYSASGGKLLANLVFKYLKKNKVV